MPLEMLPEARRSEAAQPRKWLSAEVRDSRVAPTVGLCQAVDKGATRWSDYGGDMRRDGRWARGMRQVCRVRIGLGYT